MKKHWALNYLLSTVHSEDSDQTGQKPRPIWVGSFCWFCHTAHFQSACERGQSWRIIQYWNMLWKVNWKWPAMECSVNYTIVWWSFEPAGELGSYSERTSDYDIIYRTLHGKPFSVNYPFYPIDCFGFLNSNLQCQNLLFFLCLYTDILGYLHNRIKLLQGQIKLVHLFWENLHSGYFLYPGHLFTEWCHLVLLCTWVLW